LDELGIREIDHTPGSLHQTPSAGSEGGTLAVQLRLIEE
jgi:hypothetical protein